MKSSVIGCLEMESAGERVWGREDVHAVTQLTSSLVLQLAFVQIMSDDLKAWSPTGVSP
jgi:hypothetical protein